MKKNVTYQDIARYTGFSKTTVSRYFNHPETVRPEYRAKIQEALEVFDYKENKVAQILAKGHTEIVGLIVPNLYISFYAELLDHLLKTYDTYGYKFLVFSSNGNRDVERKYVQELQAYQAEGIIMLGHTIPSHELADYAIPVVGIEREDQFISSVNTNNYAGAILAMEHLRRQKCDRYYHINSQNYNPDIPSSARIKAFKDFCEKENLPYEICYHSMGQDYEELQEEVEGIVERIIADGSSVRKGIFCSSDTAASIVLNKIYSTFGRLPDDYKIIGFDGTSIASRSIIPFSTVQQQIDVICDRAMSLLLEQMNARRTDAADSGTHQKPVHEVVDPILIPR